MARLIQSHKESNFGYNTKDDPITLKENEVTSLINAYPSIGSPKPREGTGLFSGVPQLNDIYFSIPYEDDDQAPTVITILTDGEIWGQLENGAPFKISDSLGTPTGSFHYVSAAKAIFLFSDQEEFNVIIEQSLSTSPFFKVRSNFIDSIPWDGKTKQNSNHVWSVSTGPGTLTNLHDATSDIYSSAKFRQGDDENKEVLRNPDRYIYKGYCYSLVRREDDVAFDINGNPIETTTWNTGVLESPIDLEANVRYLAFKRDPENDIRNNIYDPDYANSGSQLILENDFVVDKNGKFYRATQSGNTNIDRLSDPQYFIIYTPALDGSDNDGLLGFRVNLPTRFSPNAGIGNYPIYRSDVNQSVTHLRLYSTLLQGSKEEAKGATFRFLVDLPIESIFDDNWSPGAYVHNPYYIDKTTDAELSGSDNSPVTFGVSKPPLGTMSYYHQGRIWIGGVKELQGRFFPSVIPNDAVEYKKFLTLFKPETEWIDTNQDTGDSPTGIGETTDYLIFLMKRSVWALFRGDIDSAPIRLTTSRGCPFPRSITQSEKTLFYLSSEGPAIIEGRKVVLMDSFKAGECWPKLGSNDVLKNGRKTIFQISDQEKKDVIGWYHKDCYFFSYKYSSINEDSSAEEIKAAIIGFYFSPIGQSQGAWEINHGLPYLDHIEEVISFGSNMALIRCKSDSPDTQRRFYSFLNEKVRRDIGSPFVVKSKSKRYYADPSNRNIQGQMYDILIYTRYDDLEDMAIAVYMNEDNVVATSNYFLDGNENPQNLNKTFRNNIRFGFPEGVFGNFFEVEWSKIYDGNFDIFGWDIRYHKVRGAINKFVTTDSQILVDIDEEGVGYDQISSRCNPLKVYQTGSN